MERDTRFRAGSPPPGEDGGPAPLPAAGGHPAPAGPLLAASAAALFLELALIRWIPEEVRVAAYFPNLFLIAAFLGLGIGALRAGRRDLFGWWAPSVALLAIVVIGLGNIVFTEGAATEHLWLLYYDLPQDAPIVQGVRLPLLLLFVLATVVFVPLGQVVGNCLREFKALDHPLSGYSWDLAGSLVGVLGFAALAFVGSGPEAWFGVVAVVGLVPLRRAGRGPWLVRSAAYVGGWGVVLTAVLLGPSTIHSPYYALDPRPHDLPHDPKVELLANGSVHQIALSLVRSRPPEPEWAAWATYGYHRPYDLLGRPPRRALVLGAGTGNDVSVLLDRGAERVDAVEIDPKIAWIGRVAHPDRPYEDPRVRVHVTDARAFVNEAAERYDVIVFGTLDSMTRLSAMSSVRLDTYVYTLESLRAAAERLTDDGGLMLYFMVATPYIHDRLVGMLTDVFGEPPRVYRRNHYLFNTVFMAGPAFAGPPPAEMEDVEWTAAAPTALDLPSDDWPFLYLAERSVGGFYLGVLAFIALFALLLVLWASPAMRGRGPAGDRPDVEMFLFGVGFLLLETRFVTAMNLVWGATWVASAAVFAAILAVVLAGTVLTAARPVPLRWALVGLFLALGAAWFAPVGLLVRRALWAKALLSLALVGIPVFFASLCFALRFKERPSVERAFGWNLLGAVFGGLAEFLGMAIGLRALLLIAAGAYAGVALLAGLDRPGRARAGLDAPPRPRARALASPAVAD